MADMRPKVEVGQVYNNGAGSLWRITKVGDRNGTRYCWGVSINKDGIESEEDGFGILKADDTPFWSDRWKLQGSTSQASVSVAGGNRPADSDLKFFQRPAHPDVCQKCAAPKPCQYHN